VTLHIQGPEASLKSMPQGDECKELRAPLELKVAELKTLQKTLRTPSTAHRRAAQGPSKAKALLGRFRSEMEVQQDHLTKLPASMEEKKQSIAATEIEAAGLQKEFGRAAALLVPDGGCAAPPNEAGAVAAAGEVSVHEVAALTADKPELAQFLDSPPWTELRRHSRVAVPGPDVPACRLLRPAPAVLVSSQLEAERLGTGPGAAEMRVLTEFDESESRALSACCASFEEITLKEELCADRKRRRL
ncbi:unnamed protein product, partial [Prorocentrum cordatum]